MMNWLIASGLCGLAASCVIPPLRVVRKLKHFVAAHQVYKIQSGSQPRTVIILPCKGQADELRDLEDNLQAMLTQDYQDYRMIFAVGDPDDIALPILNKLADQHPNTKVVIAEHRPGQSQKISNQLRALDELDDDDEVIVFMDSDARPDPNHLANLIAPLADPTIGTTTGFRWYTPVQGGFGSWLRAAWNLGGMPFLIEPKYNYAWGGAMAIRREVFDACGIAQYWSTALSDDLGLSLLVKKAGYRIHLAPQCLVHSPEDLTLLQTIEWTSRQTLVCRIYNPMMWRDLFIGELITSVTLMTAAVTALHGIQSATPLWTTVGAAAILLIASGRSLYQAQIIQIARRLSPQLVNQSATWPLILLAPLVNPLMLYNSFKSWLSRKMTWRGITYYLKGPQDIQVIT